MEFLALIVVAIVIGIIASLFNRRPRDYYRQRHYSDRYAEDYNQWYHPGSSQYPYYPPQYPQYPHAPYDPYQEQQREYHLRRYQEQAEYNRNVWLILAVVFGLGMLAVFFKYEFAGDAKEKPETTPEQYNSPHYESPQATAPPESSPTSSTSERYVQPLYKTQKKTTEEKNYYARDRSTLPIYLQARSSRFAHEATRSMRECQELGLSCIRRKVQENGRVWYRVYVGPFETVEEAGELKIALGESGWTVERVE